jgi:hypothetical protein
MTADTVQFTIRAARFCTRCSLSKFSFDESNYNELQWSRWEWMTEHATVTGTSRDTGEQILRRALLGSIWEKNPGMANSSQKLIMVSTYNILRPNSYEYHTTRDHSDNYYTENLLEVFFRLSNIEHTRPTGQSIQTYFVQQYCFSDMILMILNSAVSVPPETPPINGELRAYETQHRIMCTMIGLGILCIKGLGLVF